LLAIIADVEIYNFNLAIKIGTMLLQ